MKKLILLFICCITILTGCNKQNENKQNEYEPTVHFFETEKTLNIDDPRCLEIFQTGNPSLGYIYCKSFWSGQFAAIINDGSHYDGYRIYIIDDSIKHIGNYTYFTVDSVWKTVPIVNIEY